MSFFDPKGISQTEATSLANSNAEQARVIERELERLHPTTQILHRGDKELVRQTSNIDVDNVLALLAEKARLYEFSAWLREAVSKKAAAMEAEKSSQYEEDSPPVRKPSVPLVDERWVLNQFTIKEMGEYLALEAAAAVYGKALHNDGFIQEWQKENNLPELTERRDDLISIPMDKRRITDVNAIASKVFDEHKSITKKLNWYKARIEKEVNAENSRINGENSKLAAEYASALKDFHAEQAKKRAEFESQKLERIKQVAAYKIAIPKEFQNV